MNDSINLTDGYEGFQATNRAIDNEAQGTQSLAKKQHGHTENLLGSQKGSFAKASGNASTATANNYMATGNVQGKDAEGGSRFVRDTATAEESGRDMVEGQAQRLEQQAADFNVKSINRD